MCLDVRLRFRQETRRRILYFIEFHKYLLQIYYSSSLCFHKFQLNLAIALFDFNSEISQEQAEFEAFINNPEHGIFFKDYLSAPEERREEMRIIFKALMEN